MARPKFVIETKEDIRNATHWISGQFNNVFKFNFPCEDFEQVDEAKDEFNNLNNNDSSKLNIWCEKWLDSQQWMKLKGSIRAKRLKKKRAFSEVEKVITVNLTESSYEIIKRISKRDSVTLSDVIKKYLHQV